MAQLHLDGVSRRDLLRLSLSSAAFLAVSGSIISLTGCGGSGGGEDSDELTVRSMTGSVSTAELGGTGHQVISLRQTTTSPVDTTGSFSTAVVDGRAQIVMVGDGQKLLRGLAVALPGTPLVVNAATTALALAHMSLGVATSDAALAREMHAPILAHPRYSEYAALVKAALPQGGIAAAIAATKTILEEILNDAHPQTEANRGTLPTNANIRFSGKWGTGGANAQGLDISNGAFRYVRLDVEQLDSNKTSLGHLVARTPAKRNLTAFEPAGLLSISSLPAALVGRLSAAPAEATILLNLRQPVGIGRVKVWVRSVGLKPGETPPTWAKRADVLEATVKSMLWMVVMPFFDAVFGGLGFKKALGNVLDAVNKIYSGLGGALGGNGLLTAFDASNWGAITTWCIETVAYLISNAALVAELAGWTFFGAAAATVLAPWIAGVGLFITTANLALIRVTLANAPRCESIELQVSAAEVVVR